MKRFRVAALAVALAGVLAVPVVSTAPSAEAHGWITSPPSRQDHCAKGTTSFDCGPIKYEPQSVEALKGSKQCNGGQESFAILNDDSKPWPVTNVGSSVTFRWNLTAAHNTSTWEYFVDGVLHRTYDQGGAQPASDTSHTLTDLPAGKHTVLARWNVSNTPMAFYNCVDINVGGTTTPTDPEPEPTDPPAEPGECTAAPYSSTQVYNGGDKVSHGGRDWEARWWTQGEQPSTAASVWKDLGACAGTPTDPAPDPDPDPTEPTEPTDPTTPGECTAAPYSSTQVYNGGDKVSHGGRDWEARWWTQGEQPSTGASVWKDLGACAATDPTPDPDPDPTDPTDPPAEPGDYVVGYFTNWGVYGRNYHVKNIETSGSADKLTHILYAFGNVQNGRCTVGDSYADYEKAYTAADSVDGVADTWDQELRGNFNQLRKLKAENPNLKVLWSFGGWTWSGGFAEAAQNPQAFAESCHDLVEDPRWADVFDGIDIDWEYPNACGLTCDTSGRESFPTLMKELRDEFGDDLVTAAITADGTDGGKIDAADYAEAATYVDFYMPMTYDFFGAWAKEGPTAPHSPLTSYDGIPTPGFDTTTTIAKLRSLGVPSDKLLLGLGFYGRGWTGVSQEAPGGTATGPAAGTYEAGIEDYKVLRNECPATGTVAGTAYAFCDGEWWSYDTPATIAGKMEFAKDQGLAGAFFWELSGDTADGELITAIDSGLR